GQLYCYEIASGELNWYNDASNQMIVLDNFEELPMVQLTSRYQKRVNQFNSQQVIAIRTYNKQTGKLLFEREDSGSVYQQQFHALKVDSRNRKAELINYNRKIVYHFDGSTGAAKEGGGKEGGKGTGGSRPGEGSTLPGNGPGPGFVPPPPPPGGGFRPKF